MLRTSDEHQFDAYPFGYGDGVKMWHAVSLELPTPYFFVCHAIRVGKGWLQETCLLWRKTDVLNLCRRISLDKERKILQVSILRPAEGSARWHMEEIKEIWRDVGTESVQPAIFITRDGRQLGRGYGSQRAAPHIARERIYCSNSCGS